jgi:hypothetical protein
MEGVGEVGQMEGVAETGRMGSVGLKGSGSEATRGPPRKGDR